MSNWKEQLEKLEEPYENISYPKAVDFISTQIIEKLIADIPDRRSREPYPFRKIKQQLRDKWL